MGREADLSPLAGCWLSVDAELAIEQPFASPVANLISGLEFVG